MADVGINPFNQQGGGSGLSLQPGNLNPGAFNFTPQSFNIAPNSTPGPVQGPVRPGQVLGASSYLSPGGNPQINAPLNRASQDVANSGQNQVNTQTGLTNAQIQTLSDQYDAIAQQLGIAKTEAGNTYGLGKADIQQQLGTTLGLYGNAANTATTQEQQQQNAALQNFRDLQLQNRNVARSQGALDSSYYGDLQNRAGLQYSTQTGNMQQDLSNSLNQINIQKAGAAQAGQVQLAKLADAYQNQIAQLQVNENLTARQKADKINEAQADLQNKVANIQQGVQQFQATLGETQSQIAGQLAAAQAYAAGMGKANTPTPATPTAQPNFGITTPTQPMAPQGASVNNDPLKQFVNGLPVIGGIANLFGY
jgi:hypothetical protein